MLSASFKGGSVGTAEALRGTELGIDRARALEARIRDESLRAKDGSLAWIGPNNPGEAEPIQLRAIGPQLYGGTTGIALFLAALEHLEAGESRRDLVLEILSPLRRRLDRFREEPAKAASLRLGIGGFIGLGSLVYAFARIGHWIDEPSLVQEALDLVPLFTPERVSQDPALDVVSGSAGAILALLTVDELTASIQRPGAASPLEAARLCGDHLLKNRVAVGGLEAWQTVPQKPPLAGFAHGIAGIAHALFRLSLRTGEPEFRQAAEEGVRGENTYYAASHRNWRDARVTATWFPCAWCYGAPGIALGRIASWAASEEPTLRTDAENALQTTAEAPLSRLDPLCCGNMGRIEILLYAAVRAQRPELFSKAREIAARCMSRMAEVGDFQWVLPTAANPFDPSLLTGAAGIGYTLLRLENPTRLPSILALE